MDGAERFFMEIFAPDHGNRRAYRDTLGCFSTGVTVVTASRDGEPFGITANSFASVSLDPPLVLWSPARESDRFDVFARATHTAIHVLSVEQADLAMHFARSATDFDDLSWHMNDEGVPVLDNALARFECVASAQYDGGDHVILVSHVLRAARKPGLPLIFANGQFGGFTETD